MTTVTRETFESLLSLQAATNTELNWSSPFTLPSWMSTWWRHFRAGKEPYIAVVRDDSRPIGVAPLQVENGVASLVGSDNVCDYLDFVPSNGLEEKFFTVLLDDLRKQGITEMDLGLLRPDSSVVTVLEPLARQKGLHTSLKQEDVSSEMELPPTFDEYLATLNTKQRHEVRRKLRRLNEAGQVEYHYIDNRDALQTNFDLFLRLFSMAREDKARFMTPEMEAFFRSLARATAEMGILRLGLLELDSRPAAMVMCFDYNNTVYLYNSGYDPELDSLSVGLLSKVLCIRESIQQGKRRFEFLKGNEVYKERLGGKEIPLYRCRIRTS